MQTLCLTLPNGMMFFFGPVEGCRHDSGVLTLSGWLNSLHQLADVAGNPFWILGDKGSPCASR